MTELECEACGAWNNVEDFCRACGSSWRAVQELRLAGIDPALAHAELTGREKYKGINFGNLTLIIETFRTKHDKPN